MTSQILEKVQVADNLPTLPTVALEVLRLTRSDDATVADLAEVIQNDPALTAKILKVVNSSLFGMPRKTSSVQQAMVVLGLRTVKVMALSFSLVDTMRTTKGGKFDYKQYWRRSLTMAVASRLIAERTHSALRDDAFVGGLLADIGMLAALHCASEHYTEVLCACQETRVLPQDAERRILGFTHATISKVLLQTWSLPDVLVAAVGAHHGDEADSASPNHRPLVQILRSAACVADLFCQESPNEALDAVKAHVREWTGMSDATLDSLLNALDDHVQKTASLFNLDIGTTRNYADIQNDAMMQLARLSVTAEIERAQAAQQVQQLADETRELKQKANIDALTRINNRASFNEHLSRQLEAAARDGCPLGLIMLDIDHFKRLNDTFGHQTGDTVLREVGQCLERIQNDTQFAARYGGEEFAIIVANTTADAVRQLAEETRLAIQRIRVQTNKQTIGVTASFGAAVLPTPQAGQNEEAIVRLADECLYKAKSQGRNRVVVSV